MQPTSASPEDPFAPTADSEDVFGLLLQERAFPPPLEQGLSQQRTVDRRQLIHMLGLAQQGTGNVGSGNRDSPSVEGPDAVHRENESHSQHTKVVSDATERFVYDPDNPSAVHAKLTAYMAMSSSSSSCMGTDATFIPTRVQRPAMPSWMRRLSDLLLFSNNSGGDVRRSGYLGCLPAYSALVQLRADLAEARQMLEDAKKRNDAPLSVCRTASNPYVIAPDTVGASPSYHVDGESSAAVEMEPVHVASRHEDRVSLYPEAHPAATYTSHESGVVNGHERALEKALLACSAPPWMQPGAEEQLLTDLVTFLSERLTTLEQLFSRPTGNATVELIGAPPCSGVDGTLHLSLPPAVQRAFATHAVRTLLSDLFATSSSAFRDRALRYNEAFVRQIPLVHDRYIAEEDCMPIFDPSKLRLAHMPQPPPPEELAALRSFSIHVDYIRFRPSKGSNLFYSAFYRQRGDLDRLSREEMDTSIPKGRSHPSTTGARTSSPTCPIAGLSRGHAGGRDGVTVIAAAARAAASASAARKALLPFSPEEYLIAILLDHLEAYRLLSLNLCPHLKSRHVYQAQLHSLRGQHKRTPEMDQLQTQLETLLQASADLERKHLTSMMHLWEAVLHIRGGDTNDGVVDSQRETFPSTNSARTPLKHHNVPGEVSRSEPSQSGDVMQFMTPSLSTVPLFALTHAAMTPLGTPQVEQLDATRTVLNGTASLFSGDRRPAHQHGCKRFGFSLRRVGDNAGAPYVRGDDVLHYVPEIEGVDLLPSLSSRPLWLDGEEEDRGEPRARRPSHFRVVVFARTNATMAPQYVGSTAPCALTATNVCFCNETFEIRAPQEPLEILLHVVPEGRTDPADLVASTVQVRPSLTRAYSILPMQAPIAFMYRGKTHAKYTGEAVEGVVALSTTWTTAQGLGIEQMEDLFVSGAADPMDPEYAPLLRILKAYYMECDRAEAEVERRLADSTSLRASLSRRGAVFSHTPLPQPRGGPLYSTERRSSPKRNPQEGGLSLACPVNVKEESLWTSRPLPSSVHSQQRKDELVFVTQRLQLMRRRWLIASGQTTATDPLEVRLLQFPIPLSEADGHDLRKKVKREVAKEDAKRAESYGGTIFDEKSYYDEPSSVSGLALSPLPNATKLKLWQERQRRLKLTRCPSRTLTDEERLEQVVTLPKPTTQLVFHTTPRSQLNPRRAARPRREEIDLALLQRRRDSRIVVHLMRGHHLPRRLDGTPLEPFVQASFVYETAYSRSAVGSSPSWFQSIELPFQPLDFEEDTLRLIDDDLILSVYDKVEIPLPAPTTTLGAVSHETHYRTERRLLGTLHLPFSTLHEAEDASIEGIYPLQAHQWALGYERKPEGEEEEGAGCAVTGASLKPSLQVYITLCPPLQRDKSKAMSSADLEAMVQQLNVSEELGALHKVALKWRKVANAKVAAVARMNPFAKDRTASPFVFCSSGDLVLVCRYLLEHGGPPPTTVDSVHDAIRYVSLIPFIADTMAWGEKDVWSTNSELLAMRSGDYEELALLLAHFLRYLAPDRTTLVVIGNGEVYRQTVVVLHDFGTDDLHLIDPRTGIASSIQEPYGTTLRDVHMVLSHNQIWMNLQLSGLPHRMLWDLDSPVAWLPCFDTRKDRRLCEMLPHISPLQRERLSFQPIGPHTTIDIEQSLRTVTKRALIAWRNQRQPSFHHGVEAILRELLIDAEKERCGCGSILPTNLINRAQRRLCEYFDEPVHRRRRRSRSRSRAHSRGDTDAARHDGQSSLLLVGSPVAASYNPADKHFNQVLQQVFETAAHEVGTDHVSFAVGTYVKSYTGNVHAMWVFLVAICRDVGVSAVSRPVGGEGSGPSRKRTQTQERISVPLKT